MSSLTGRAKQSKNKILVFSRIVRRQTISNRLSYCLSRDIKAITMRQGSHGEKAHWDVPPDCLSFSSWRLLCVVSTWFDNVLLLFVLLAGLTLEESALPWTVCWGPQLTAFPLVSASRLEPLIWCLFSIPHLPFILLRRLAVLYRFAHSKPTIHHPPDCREEPP